MGILWWRSAWLIPHRQDLTGLFDQDFGMLQVLLSGNQQVPCFCLSGAHVCRKEARQCDQSPCHPGIVLTIAYYPAHAWAHLLPMKKGVAQATPFSIPFGFLLGINPMNPMMPSGNPDFPGVRHNSSAWTEESNTFQSTEFQDLQACLSPNQSDRMLFPDFLRPHQ